MQGRTCKLFTSWREFSSNAVEWLLNCGFSNGLHKTKVSKLIAQLISPWQVPQTHSWQNPDISSGSWKEWSWTQMRSWWVDVSSLFTNLPLHEAVHVIWLQDDMTFIERTSLQLIQHCRSTRALLAVHLLFLQWKGPWKKSGGCISSTVSAVVANFRMEPV